MNGLVTAVRESPAEPFLTWLDASHAFPPVDKAWGADSSAPGLLAAGSELHADLVLSAYQQGVFPWFSEAQPVLWWSPDPRMVLPLDAFRLHRSLRQSLKRHLGQPGFDLCFDRDFAQVMQRCADQSRRGQKGSWIVPRMVQAYTELHRRGHAHSAEVWKDGKLVAGLYFVCLGHAVFGESMFTDLRDGSKMALAMLVSAGRRHGVPLIDCQQNTRHLASLGAHEIPRAEFLQSLQISRQQADIDWRAETLYWDTLDR